MELQVRFIYNSVKDSAMQDLRFKVSLHVKLVRKEKCFLLILPGLLTLFSKIDHFLFSIGNDEERTGDGLCSGPFIGDFVHGIIGSLLPLIDQVFDQGRGDKQYQTEDANR